MFIIKDSAGGFQPVCRWIPPSAGGFQLACRWIPNGLQVDSNQPARAHSFICISIHPFKAVFTNLKVYSFICRWIHSYACGFLQVDSCMDSCMWIPACGFLHVDSCMWIPAGGFSNITGDLLGLVVAF
jgi:hypothetical protein